MAITKEASTWPVNQTQLARGSIFCAEQNREEKNPAVAIFPGMTSNEVPYWPLAERLAAMGITVLTVNLRGHGSEIRRSDGNFNTLTVADLFRDIIAAYQHLISLPSVDKERIGAIGTSVGGYLLSSMSRQYRFHTLLLRAPALYTQTTNKLTLAQTMQQQFTLFHGLSETDIQNSTALTAIADYRGAFAIVISKKDEIVAPDVTDAYYEAASRAFPRERHILPDASHGLSDPQREIFSSVAVEWFEKTLKPTT